MLEKNIFPFPFTCNYCKAKWSRLQGEDKHPATPCLRTHQACRLCSLHPSQSPSEVPEFQTTSGQLSYDKLPSLMLNFFVLMR